MFVVLYGVVVEGTARRGARSYDRELHVHAWPALVMGARKKKTEDAQASLFAAVSTVASGTEVPRPRPRFDEDELDLHTPLPRTKAPAPDVVVTDQEYLSANYRLNWWVRERPNGVTVTPCADGQYLVERVRDNGTTFAAWLATRVELEQLVEKAKEALA